MEILGNKSFSISFDRAGSKLICLYDSASFARLLDHNNLCQLPLGWKEAPFKDCIS